MKIHQLLETKNPNSKEYKEGFSACKRGIQREENPYDAGSIMNQNWKDGWDACAKLSR